MRVIGGDEMGIGAGDLGWFVLSGSIWAYGSVVVMMGVVPQVIGTLRIELDWTLLQCGFDLALILETKSDMAMDVSPVKEDIKVRSVPSRSFEVSSFAMEALSNKNAMAPTQTAEAGINITDCGNPGEEGIVARGYHDVTESSSSFGDTDPGTSSSAVVGDDEVESRWREDDTMFPIDDDLFPRRKKKVTTHWKKFVHPLMWRCKWLELHIKELQSQSTKYDKELALCELGKQQGFQRFTSADHHVKSTPSLCQSLRANMMKRKKRRKVEETVDVASYLAEHNLFSYYVNKRPFPDDGYMDNDCAPSVTAAAVNNARSKVDGVNGDWVPLKFKDVDSFEDMLRKIGEAQAQVYQLRHRMRSVLCECAEKFASSDSLNLLAPHDPLTNSAAHPDLRFTDGEAKRGYHSETLFLAPEQKASEQVMPESAVSSYGEVAPPPDMVEGIDQPLAGPSCEKIVEPNLVYNRRVKQESHGHDKFRMQHVPIGKPQLRKDQQARSADSLFDMKCESPDMAVVSDKQPTPKPQPKSVTPKGKKKRGKRKAGSSKWT
ncbi:hypothetical protein AKJ16_DCAP20705 [Drosera capensis]